MLALLLISAPLIMEQPHDARGMPTGPVLANGAPLELPVSLDRARCPPAPEDNTIVWRFDQHDRWAVLSTWLRRLEPCGLDRLKLADPSGAQRSVGLWRDARPPEGLLNIHQRSPEATEQHATLLMGAALTTVQLGRAEHLRALSRMPPAQRVLYFHPETLLSSIHERLAELPATLSDIRVSLEPVDQRSEPLLALINDRATPKDFAALASMPPSRGALARIFGYAVAAQKLKVERPSWISLEDPIACTQKDKAYIWARGKSSGIRNPALARTTASNRGRMLTMLFIQTDGNPRPKPRSFGGTLHGAITLDTYVEEETTYALIQKEAPSHLRALAKRECPTGVTVEEVWKPRPVELDGSTAKVPPDWAQRAPVAVAETIRWTRPAPLGTKPQAAQKELLQALQSAAKRSGGPCAARAIAWSKLPFETHSGHFGALGRTMIAASISRESLANALGTDCEPDWLKRTLSAAEQALLWEHPELREGAKRCAVSIAKRMVNEDHEAQLGRVYWKKDREELPIRPLYNFMVDKIPQSAKTLNILDVQLHLTDAGGDRFLVVLGEFRAPKHQKPAFSRRCWRVFSPQRGTPTW